MKKMLGYTRKLQYVFILFLLTAFTAGCGNWDGDGSSASFDTTAPTVTLAAPVNAATGVPINQAATATFSEAMNPLTVTAATFTLQQGTTPVAGTVSYTGVTAIFTPLNSLAPNTTYTATITTATTDLAGNALAAPHTWIFTTGNALDIIAPVVIARSGVPWTPNPI